MMRRLSIILLLTASLCLLHGCVVSSFSFVVLSITTHQKKQQNQQQQQQQQQQHTVVTRKRRRTTTTSTHLYQSNNDQNNQENDSILSRFTSPTLDDPYLPLSDALVAQIIAPGLQILSLSIRGAPRPSWCKPIIDTNLLTTTQGSYLAPTLIHGAALASCWLIGALAAQAYTRNGISPQKVVVAEVLPEEDTTTNNNTTIRVLATDPRPPIKWDYSQVISTILQAGAFASGVLILSTQLDLYVNKFGFQYVQWGDSKETDFTLLVAAVELISDIFWEAITITVWRLYLAYQTERQYKERQ